MLNIFRFCITSCLAGVPHNYGPIGHLKLPKFIWPEVIKGSGVAIDATCGNGYDSEYIARLLYLDRKKEGDQLNFDSKPTVSAQETKLYCMDIQEDAVGNTKKRLESVVHASKWLNVQFVHGSHETFPSCIEPQSVSLICYNLGYLPGTPRDKDGGYIQTKKDSTERSLLASIPLLKEDGLLSVTAYPGNTGGDEEQRVVHEIVSSLSPSDWRVYHHAPLNRPLSPHLYLVYRIGKSGILI